MPLITEAYLESLVHLPVQLPATRLPPGAWLIVASAKVDTGQTLTLKWLQLSLHTLANADASDPCAGNGAATIDAEFLTGSVASTLLIADFVADTAPNLQAYSDLLVVPSDFTTAPTAVPPLLSVRGGADLVLDVAATYSLVVLNNTANRDAIVSVSGAWLLDTNE